MSNADLIARRLALAKTIKPLTAAEKALLRRVIDEEIARVKLDVSNPDDRLAAFFGAMEGRAGFDPTSNKLDELWSDA